MRELVNFVRTLYHKIDLIVNDLKYDIVFVLGNSSCDMDSFISAILLSFIRNVECRSIDYTNQHELTYNNFSKNNKLYIPIVNCKKGELKWRLDIAELLKAVELEEHDFFYFEDIYDLKTQNCIFEETWMKRKKGIAVENNYSVILVDHHILDSHQEFLADKVVEIIDHHNDNKYDYKKTYHHISSHNIIFPRSSALCLILEELFQKEKENFKEMVVKMFTDLNFHDMILAPLVNDSVNFLESEKDKKWVDKDLELANKIIKLCHRSIFFDTNSNVESIQPEKFYIEHLGNILTNVKFDKKKNLNLGVEALLKKDSKSEIYDSKQGKYNILYSSLPCELDTIIQTYSLKETVKVIDNLSTFQESDCLVLGYIHDMNHFSAYYFSKKGKFYKDGNQDKKKIDEFLNYIIKGLNISGLINFNDINDGFLYIQTKESLSRKLITPIIEGYFKSLIN